MENSFIIAVLINQTKYSTCAYSLEGCIMKQSLMVYIMFHKLHAGEIACMGFHRDSYFNNVVSSYELLIVSASYPLKKMIHS